MSFLFTFIFNEWKIFITLSPNVSSETLEGFLEFQGYSSNCIDLNYSYEVYFVITYVPNLNVCSSVTWKLLIANHLKPSITKKRRNKAKYLPCNSLRLKFVKKTSMPKPVKSVAYTGFDLSFQNWFMSFLNENKHKTDLKFLPTWLVDEENFSL